MLRKIGLFFLFVGTTAIAATVGYRLYSSKFHITSTDIRLLVAFTTGLIAIGRTLSGKNVPKVDMMEIEKAYADIVKDVFPENDHGKKQLLQALVLFNADKHRRAIISLKALLKSCETNRETAAIHFFIALCHEDQDHQHLAFEHYRLAIQYNPSNDTALCNLGLIYREMGCRQHAIDCYKKTIEVNPNNAFAYNNIAIAYLDLAEMDVAIRYATEALKIKPDMYQAMNTLALAYSSIGDKTLSEKYYQQSIINGCSNVHILRDMMEALERKLNTPDKPDNR